MTSIRVAHPGADYEVIVGDLASNLGRVAKLAAGGRLPIISDARIWQLHGKLLADIASGDPILVPQGEPAKDWATLAGVIEALAKRGIRRGTPLVAFGGGSVGDVAGLAASLFKRGCPIIHIPTTLLAQADSAIGGKTAIDAAGQKNLVGTFHHPALVIADPALLDTLDGRQLRAGYAEVVKYGLIDDPAFFSWCERNGAPLLAGEPEVRTRAIEHCIRAKARLVAPDPDDTLGTRALLNFGHTFGHAIEAVAGNALLHGEAVAIGMTLAARLSADLELCAAADADRVAAHLRSTSLPTSLNDAGIPSDAVLAAMRGDKKATAAGLTLILMRAIGDCFPARAIDEARLGRFLARQN